MPTPFRRRHPGPHPRLRLGLLMACAAAFLLVPAANAAAVPTVHVEIKGSGSGEITDEGGLQEGPGEFNGIGEGSPTIHCSGPEPGEGVCDNTMFALFPGAFWVGAVHPIADPGSEFAGWEMTGATNNGGCEESENWELNGAVQCSFTTEDPEAEVTIVGKFELEPEPEPGDLTVEIDGSGAGEVVNDTFGALRAEPPFQCKYESPGPAEEEGEPCVRQMKQFVGKIGLSVKAKAAPGSEFVGWEIVEGINLEPESTNCNGPERCGVGAENLGENARVKATFDLIPPLVELTVLKTGSGDGTVISEPEGEPEGITCEPGCTEETTEFEEGTVVTLFAEPDGVSTFDGWTGCDSEPSPTECRLTMGAVPREVEAEFNLADRTLTVDKAGSGSGAVSCDGGACEASYPHGTEVTLTASADSGSTFEGWSGGGCSGTGTCVVTLEADTTVTATFNANPTPAETCATNPALCPAETCATNPALCPPPPEEKCTVPKLAKKTLGQAKAALKAAHCALGKVTKPKKAKGTLVVKSSKPGAGTVLPANSKVNLKLGPKPKKKKK